MISSPCTGLQHLESFTKQLSIPLTMIPVFDFERTLLVWASWSSSIFSSMLILSLFSFLYSSKTLEINLFAPIDPKPTAAYISSSDLKTNLCRAGFTYWSANNSSSCNPIFFISFSTISFPLSMFCCLSLFLKNFKIFVLAWVDLINFNQSRLGPLELSFVITSTISPFFNGVIIGIILEFIFAPTILLPIWSWIKYAKSIGVLPFGNVLISPFGVKTYTSSSNNSVFNVAKNSCGSCISFCHSKLSRNHDNLSSLTVTFAFLPLAKLCSL